MDFQKEKYKGVAESATPIHKTRNFPRYTVTIRTKPTYFGC